MGVYSKLNVDSTIDETALLLLQTLLVRRENCKRSVTDLSDFMITKL